MESFSFSKNPQYIFLITVDALRADHVGCIGGSNLTPNIDRIAKKSLLFTRAFTNGPGTNQSFPALMTSTYFLMNDGFRLSPNFITLAEILRKNGFKTVAFHSNPFLSKTFGWDRGFNAFYDFINELKSPSAFITSKQGAGAMNKLIRFIATQLWGNRNVRRKELLRKVYYKFSGLEIPYMEGKELNKKIFNWIDNNSDAKFFLWMHYMDPHSPYIPPDEFCDGFSNRREAFEFYSSVDFTNISDAEIKKLKGLYKGEVRYTDFCIGEFIEFLEARGLKKNSVIFITSDHGEAFMEHDRFGHKPDILYNEVLHVPLLISGLDIILEIDFPVQLLDIPPTILDVLKIKRPKTFLGDSVISLIKKNKKHRLIFSESAKPDLINLKYDMNKKAISCIKNGWKLIINELLGTKELYNIKYDFNEKINLIINEPNLYLELTETIKKHYYIEKKIENSYN